MRRLALGLGFALILGVAAPAIAQTTLVILNPDNGYMDEVEPGVVLWRDPITGKGPLWGGTVVEFSCGSCAAATFDDAESQLGGSVRICGLRPVDIVLSDVRVCLRSTVSGNRYDFDLLTWDSKRFPCVDPDGGTSCASAGGNASYIRSPFVESTDPLTLVENLIRDVAGLNLPKGMEESLMTMLDGAWQKLSDSNPANEVASASKLRAFVNHLEAQAGKKLDQDDADELIAATQAVIEALPAS